jgi:hypothetical protein
MGFGKQTLVQGGGLPFAEGGFGRVLSARWTSQSPDGYESDDKPVFYRIAIQPLNAKFQPEGSICIENLRAGLADDFVPVNSKGKEVGYGTDVQKVGAKDGFSNSSKFAIFLSHAIEAGVPEDHAGLQDDTSALDGHVFAMQRIPEPEGWAALQKNRAAPVRRRGQEEKPKQAKTILVFKQWVEDEFDAKQAMEPEAADALHKKQRGEKEAAKEEKSGSRRAEPTRREEPKADAGAPASGGSRRRAAAPPADEAPAEASGGGRRRRGAAEASTGPNVDELAIAFLKKACAAEGEIKTADVRRAVFAVLKGDTSIDADTAKAVSTRAADEDFLKKFDGGSDGLDFDGKSVAELE